MKRSLLIIPAMLISSMGFSQILTEDFQTGTPPAGWSTTQSSPSVGFEFGTNLANSQYFAVPAHTRYACSNDDAHDVQAANVNIADRDRLISPVMDLTPYAATGVAVKFAYVNPESYGSTGTVEVTTDGGTTWTQVADLPATATWANGFVSLSAYTNSSTVQFCFRHNDGGNWASGVAIDDVIVEEIPANEARLNSVGLTRYSAVSTNNTLSLNVTNLGFAPITSMQVNWFDGTTNHIQTINSLNIAAGATATVNHPTLVNYATVVEKNMSVKIMQVNNATDNDTTNNTGAAKFNTVSSIVQHNVVIEEGTGTWCGWCPRGKVAMDYMIATYPNQFIGIAVHNGDPMTVTAYDNGVNLSGYPGCNVDRVMKDQGVSQAAFVNYYNLRKDIVGPASVNVTATYDATSRVIDADVTAHFVTAFAAANYRLAIIVIEDEVTGTTSGYNQTNYYANNANGPMGGFESLPSSVPAAQMVYDLVGRALLGGFNGQAGSVPTTITDLQDVTYSFNHTLPNTQDETKIKLVGVLIDQTDGSIVNAKEIELMSTTGIENNTNTISMNVYPNPSTEYVNVQLNMVSDEDITIHLYDMNGKVVYNQNYGSLNGTQILTVPVSAISSGQYIISVSTATKSYTKHLIVE